MHEEMRTMQRSLGVMEGLAKAYLPDEQRANFYKCLSEIDKILNRIVLKEEWDR